MDCTLQARLEKIVRTIRDSYNKEYTTVMAEGFDECLIAYFNEDVRRGAARLGDMGYIFAQVHNVVHTTVRSEPGTSVGVRTYIAVARGGRTAIGRGGRTQDRAEKINNRPSGRRGRNNGQVAFS